MATYAVLIITCFLLHFSASTEVESCGGDANAVVSISNCETAPCVLKRNTSVKLTIEMTPDEDVPKIQNSVHAMMGTVPLPFIGVHGTDACQNMYLLDDTKAGCPLKKGQKYMYKNDFFIHKIYPKVHPKVIWELKTPEDKKVACFEVSSKITD